MPGSAANEPGSSPFLTFDCRGAKSKVFNIYLPFSLSAAKERKPDPSGGSVISRADRKSTPLHLLPFLSFIFP